MPVITVKGPIEYDAMCQMMVYYARMEANFRPKDFDRFFIECAVLGFEEVKKHV